MQIPEIKDLEPLLRGLRPFLLERIARTDVHTKHANDFVTQKDLYVQTFLKKELAVRYPDFAFLGEEGEAQKIDPRVPCFVLDPIDGTTNFIFGYGLSAVSLALVYQGSPVVGVVYNPYNDEFFAATRGKGASLNGKQIHVLPATKLSEVLAAVGTMAYHKEYEKELFYLMREAYLSCIDIRRSGAASIDLCSLASGRVGIYFERDLSLWDYAASALILEEAGGTVTDFDGNPLTYTGKSDIAASAGTLHPALLSLLQSRNRISEY